MVRSGVPGVGVIHPLTQVAMGPPLGRVVVVVGAVVVEVVAVVVVVARVVVEVAAVVVVVMAVVVVSAGVPVVVVSGTVLVVAGSVVVVSPAASVHAGSSKATTNSAGRMRNGCLLEEGLRYSHLIDVRSKKLRFLRQKARLCVWN
jgi:hypothetical protein